MFSLRKVTAAVLVALAGVTGLLVAVGPMVVLGEAGATHVSAPALDDSPWD
jgi:hypothetical protein